MSSHPEQNESLQQTREPSLCANNCGFFANPAHRGYCSKCYRDIAAREQQRQAKEDSSSAAPDKAKKIVSDAVLEPLAALIPPTGTGSPAELLPTKQSSPAPCIGAVPTPRRVSKKKCGVCSKKVGLTGFNCKCGLVFCGVHRYAEAHQCNFDHKTTERQRLADDNPLVQASKLERL